MGKLIITADIHGSYNTWINFRKVVTPEAAIVIAGDLFDTQFGCRENADFQPEKIRNELAGLPNPKYFVYGNCDQEGFYPQQQHHLTFNFDGKKILLRHGHMKNHDASNADIIIEGHTHAGRLEKVGGKIFLNPGSMAFPRDGVASYAVIERDEIRLIRYKNKHVQKQLKIAG